MQHAMAPPDTYGSEGRSLYEASYGQHHQEQAPQTPARQSSSGAYTPSRQIGYREDYSRAQHASLEDDQYQHALGYRASSDVGPAVSQEHLRFSAHINRFASYDPRTTPVHSNRGVSVSERIKRFNASEINDTELRRQRQQPPSPQQYQHQTSQQYRKSPLSTKQPQQEHAPRSAPRPTNHHSRPVSSYRRDQEMAQDHYHSPSPETRQYQKHQKRPSPARSYSRCVSTEPASRGSSRERRSQSPADRHTSTNAGPQSYSRDRIEQERRSQSPAPSSSPSRMSETQRAARSLLAKRRQRRIEQEEKEEKTLGVNESNVQSSDHVHRAPASAPRPKITEKREEGRTDRILREARSRSMSPRTSRYSRKSLATRPPYTDLLNGAPEKPSPVTNHRASSPEPSSTRAASCQMSTQGRSRADINQSGSHVAMHKQELVSPMTPSSPVTLATRRMSGLPASQQSPTPRNSQVRNCGDTITSAETNGSASVQELKRQLWDDNEKLQVSVKPSLHSHGYSDRRTKQTSGYYSPEMAGNQGQRVRSLSPNPSKAVHGHELPASSVDPPSSSATFNSKFLQAAISSQRERHASQQPVEDSRPSISTPHRKAEYQSTAAYHHPRHHHEDTVLQHRSESPRPPIAPGKGEPHRTSSEDDLYSPRTGLSPVPSSAFHSIERVPSSAGVSTATGEVSVAKLVAKLSSVSRDDPELALQMIDNILRAESKSSSGGPGSRADIQSAIAVASQQKEADMTNEKGGDDRDDDDEDGDSESSSFDDSTSVSSITNPTYQRDDKVQTQILSTSNSRNPRPSSLSKYSQLHTTSPPEEQRGKSSKEKKETKPPPPATIKVNKSDSCGSNGNKERSGSKRENRDRDQISTRKVRGLSPPSKDKKRDRLSKPESRGMDAAAIALKIQGWDDQINNSMEEPPVGMMCLEDAPLSPTRTEDTAATEELGSIVTPQSQKHVASESRRSHPWDDKRPQNNRKPRAIDLPIGTCMKNDFGNDEVMANAFEPSSPWQRRRAAKRETEESAVPDTPTESGLEGSNRGYGQQTGTRSRSSTPRSTLSNSRIAPNVYDVHRKRRSRSGSRDRRPDSASPTLEKNTPSATKQPERVNPFKDSSYKNPPTSTKSESANHLNPFDSSYTNPFSSSKSDVGTTFEPSDKRRPRSSNSDTGNIFDSAWVALPADAFPGPPVELRDRPRENVSITASSLFPDDVDTFGVPPAANYLPPITPTNRASFEKQEEAPEASRNPKDGASKSRRSFLNLRRSSTPRKDRTPSQERNSSKPLLRAYAMDSGTDVKDEFKVRPRASRSPAGRRSRTLSPAPRSVLKSRSPGRNRLKSRTGSFTDGEDDTSSLTGSLTGSTTSSVRNKNLAKKFSRFLKVYED